MACVNGKEELLPACQEGFECAPQSGQCLPIVEPEPDISAPPEDSATEDAQRGPEECTPACEGKVCGDDGCGGSCGTCDEASACTDGQCQVTCSPECAEATCGDDGCGGSCGECAEGETCQGGQCEGPCAPDCTTASCGDDGCGGSCGECAEGEVCQEGQCNAECVGQCWQCGDDGCGNDCGSCPEGEMCIDGFCSLTNLYDAMVAHGGFNLALIAFENSGLTEFLMGIEGEGSHTVMAPTDAALNAYLESEDVDIDSVILFPLIQNHISEGMFTTQVITNLGSANLTTFYGNSVTAEPIFTGQSVSSLTFIGELNEAESTLGEIIASNGVIHPLDNVLLPQCVPDCEGKSCGDDGCGAECGTCEEGQSCAAGQCEGECTPNCEGKSCGDDGCGESCGECDSGNVCKAGLCQLGTIWENLQQIPHTSNIQEILTSTGMDAMLDDPDSQYTFLAPHDWAFTAAAEELGITVNDLLSDVDVNAEAVSHLILYGLYDYALLITPSSVLSHAGLIESPDGTPLFADLDPGMLNTLGVNGYLHTFDELWTPPPACTPECTGKSCGDDGCGGSCGQCSGTDVCDEANGECVCTPDCSGTVDPAELEFELGANQGEHCVGPDHVIVITTLEGQDFVLGNISKSNPPGAGCLINITTRPVNDVGQNIVDYPTSSSESGNVTFFDLDAGDFGFPDPQETTDFAIWCSPCGVTLDFNIAGWQSAALIAEVQGGLPMEAVSFEAQCGGDGCGESCGTCSSSTACNDYQVCECQESTDTTCIGDESWSLDSCGQLVQAVASCQFGCVGGECQGCQPDCFEKACGPDGCGGSCGVCEGGLTCGDGGLCATCWQDSDCPTGDLCLGFGPIAMCVECIADSDCKGANDSCVENYCESSAVEEPPLLVINEVDYANSQGLSFIELYNAGSTAIGPSQLNNITLYIITSAFASYQVSESFALSNITDELPASGLPAGGYIVYGAFPMAGDFIGSSTPFQVLPAGELNGNEGGLALVMSDPEADPEDMGEGANITLDTLQYGNAITSVMFFNSWIAEGDPAPEDNGLQNNKGISRCPNGGDTNNNSNDFEFRTATPGTGNSCGLVPGPGDGKN